MTSGQTTYASNITYAAHGAVKSLPFGNNVTETTIFNSRLQPEQIAAGGLLTLDFAYGATNNGNVVSQTIARPGILASVTQNYRYDGVNRLAIAAEGSTAPTADDCPGSGTNWCRDYDYDAFGNRAIDNHTGPTLPMLTPSATGQFDAVTNRIKLLSDNMPLDDPNRQKGTGKRGRSLFLGPEWSTNGRCRRAVSPCGTLSA